MSQKYKIIKWYPSLPKELKEGDILEYGFGIYRKQLDSGKYTRGVNPQEVINNPEFWEKVGEEDNVHQHLKEPIFTTEDGVDIYEGDDFYWVDERIWAVKEPDTINPFPRDTVNYKHFSSKINAEKYILLNKPSLSINGVISLYESLNDKSVDNFKKELKHLAKYGNPFS